jgi:flagellar basal body-associated protein FliL
MRLLVVLGIILIVLGIVSLAYQGITYTTREKVLEVGPIEAHKKETRTIPLPPVLGVSALAGGIILAWYSSAADRRASDPRPCFSTRSSSGALAEQTLPHQFFLVDTEAYSVLFK